MDADAKLAKKARRLLMGLSSWELEADWAKRCCDG